MPLVLVRFVALFVVWLVWSGVPDWDGEHLPLTVVFGVLSSILVLQIAYRMASRDLGGPSPAFWFRQVGYLPWLLREIVLSNLHVARVILSRKPPIRPRVLRIKAGQRTAIGRAVYANSITLTPGTVTLDVRGDELIVHALTEHTAEGLLSGEMDRRVAALEDPA